MIIPALRAIQMKTLNKILIQPGITILQAIERMDSGRLQILLVVDDNDKLLGSVTDGDIRRAILKGNDFREPVSTIMNMSPISVVTGTPRELVLSLMKERSIHCIPVVDKEGLVVGLETESRLLWQGIEDTWVVLMAGGLGMRLRPLTEEIPKPLLPINGKPIIEGILENFLEQGFRKFFVSVNYKAEMIKDYFGDGAKWGAEISYLHEDKRLGTAGALSLLPRSNLPENLLVMNADLLTTVDFRQFLDFHIKAKSQASMCVRDYSMQVPYGVVEVEGHRFKGVTEKPAHKYYINAGIYILRSVVLKSIPENEFFDITSLFENLHKEGKNMSVFPMRENWLDIGDLKEYERANDGCLKELHQ